MDFEFNPFDDNLLVSASEELSSLGGAMDPTWVFVAKWLWVKCCQVAVGQNQGDPILGQVHHPF